MIDTDGPILNGSGRGPIDRETIKRVAKCDPLKVGRVRQLGADSFTAYIAYPSNGVYAGQPSFLGGGKTHYAAAEDLRARLVADTMGYGNKPQCCPHFSNYSIRWQLLPYWEREGEPDQVIIESLAYRPDPQPTGKSPRHGFVCKHRPMRSRSPFIPCYSWQDYESMIDSVFEMADAIATSNGTPPASAVEQVIEAEGWRLLPRHKRAIVNALQS